MLIMLKATDKPVIYYWLTAALLSSFTKELVSLMVFISVRLLATVLD